MIATPRPPRTFGRPVLLAYTRRPGLLIRRTPAIERSRLRPYLSSISRVLPRTLNFGVFAALTLSPVFAMSVLLEREAELLEQCAALVVVGGGGHDGDVHPSRPVDLVLVDLVEHDLLGQTEGVVAAPVEL